MSVQQQCYFLSSLFYLLIIYQRVCWNNLCIRDLGISPNATQGPRQHRDCQFVDAFIFSVVSTRKDLRIVNNSLAVSGFRAGYIKEKKKTEASTTNKCQQINVTGGRGFRWHRQRATWPSLTFRMASGLGNPYRMECVFISDYGSHYQRPVFAQLLFSPFFCFPQWRENKILLG